MTKKENSFGPKKCEKIVETGIVVFS